MIKKYFVALGIILIVIFLTDKFVYNPLKGEKITKEMELSRNIIDLGSKKGKLIELEGIISEKRELLDRLNIKDKGQLLTKREVNSLIIDLSNLACTRDVNFEFKSNQMLNVRVELSGRFEELYNCLKDIKYSYDVYSLEINKIETTIDLVGTLLFPIEGNDE